MSTSARSMLLDLGTLIYNLDRLDLESEPSSSIYKPRSSSLT